MHHRLYNSIVAKTELQFRSDRKCPEDYVIYKSETAGGPQSSYHSMLRDPSWPRTPSHRSLAHMRKREMTIVKKIIKCEGKYTVKMAIPYCGWVCKIVESEKNEKSYLRLLTN